MLKRLFGFIGSMICLLQVQAQDVTSPATFLGYEPGTHFTAHHRIVGYFKTVAAEAPKRVQLKSYGETNEGNELLVAVVSSAENMANLEAIRQNNLRMTGLLTDRAADPQLPAVVWLSYNVHGNEASSSEVAMVLLHELLNEKNAEIRDWLKNVVVIIDPCLNPDGRERYIGWYNRMVGRHPNPDINSREHDEPWPGGRTNHYNFDLNRDWAWQTQVETQQRLALYQQWMPVIHSDYHEQYPDNPYYFAPAAEPFHEAISSWQRSFQQVIGKNHARYFDANGWLYFTRELFDLFYPAYGDTYPIFNGAIGMTFEQAGHGVSGLAVIKTDGDTLTLHDRIAHHLSTSLSTIETAAKNAASLNQEFKKYYDETQNNGSGVYRSFILDGRNEAKSAALKQLLDRNQIRYSSVKEGLRVTGYNYFSGKEETYTTRKSDWLVTTAQSKGVLARVLFEPNARLVDSVTYDITAWSMPYAYGIPAIAVKEKLAGTNEIKQRTSVSVSSGYGYLIRYQSFRDGQLLATLLKDGYRVRISEKPLVFAGQQFDRGSLIILKAGNEPLYAGLPAIFQQFEADATAIPTGFSEGGVDVGSDKIHLLKKTNVLLVTGDEAIPEAAGEIWHYFDQKLDYPLTLVNGASLAGMNLNVFDVIIFPSGNYKILGDKDQSAVLRNWIKQGGRLLALEQAVNQVAALDWGIRLRKGDGDKADDKPGDYSMLRKYSERERDQITDFIPGAIYRVELDNSHPIAFGYPDYFFLLKQHETLIEFSKEGWNAGVIRKQAPMAGFVGANLKARIKDGTVVAVQPMGRGQVICFTDDPVFRGFWENGNLLLLNAVFLTGAL